MRLFIAVQLSDEMKNSLIEYMHGLKKAGIGGNYTAAQNLHLTLCFIGETNEYRTIAEALQGISYKPFKLSLTDTGAFGDLQWVGVRSGQALNGLVKDIRAALDARGIAYDAKKFVPHITLVREAKGPVPQTLKKPQAEMTVKKVSLMKSERKNGKLVYTEVLGF